MDILIGLGITVAGVVMAFVGIDSEKLSKKARAIVVILSAAVVGLTWWQLIRSEDARAIAAAETNAAALRNEGNMQYLKGELSMLVKVLSEQHRQNPPTTVAATTGGSSSNVQPLPNNKKQEIRTQLAKFLVIGGELAAKCLQDTSLPAPQKEANEWASEINKYLRENLEPAYSARFLNPAPPLPITHTGVPSAHDGLWRGIQARLSVLRQFIEEFRD